MTETPSRPHGPLSDPSRRRPRGALPVLGIRLLLALSCLLAAWPAAAQSAERRSIAQKGTRGGYVRAGSIGEVLSRWEPEIHLYVLGDVGLEADALAELAAWIGDRHWTVLLVEDASAQSFTDAQGQVHQGEDAIQWGTGQGIPRRRGFAAQVHPTTGEPDGAILSIVIAQRALFYTGSQAQDSRSLGEDRFQGGLDSWAIQAMRSGGDIGTAVRDTVSNVDSLLETAIAREMQQADGLLAEAGSRLDLLERRSRALAEAAPGAVGRLGIPAAAGLRARVAAARQARGQGRAGEAARQLESVLAEIQPALNALDSLRQRLAFARSVLTDAAAAVTRLEEKAAGLRRSHPRLDGPIARPDVEGLRRELAAAEPSLGDDPEPALRAIQAVHSRALAQIQAIEEYPATGEALAAARSRLADLDGRERAAAARERLLAARQALTEAEDRYRRGTPGYAERLAEASSALAAAEREISAADTAAALGRAALLVLLAVLAATLAGTGFVLNRRRRPVKREAEQLLADWDRALDRKLEVLIEEMEQRIGLYLGPASGADRRPYAGETPRLADASRADIGSLYILWTSANKVLETAAALIRARGLSAVHGFFFPGRYRRGIALLRDEPVPFDPAEGLPRIFGQERTWRDDLLGDLASYEPFRKSFQEIVAELDLRAARAAAALDRVQSSLDEGPHALDETGERLRRTASLREELERAAAAEGLFRLTPLFDAALPAATAALTRARALLPADPVGAVAGDGAAAGRISIEAAQLAGLAAAARRGVLAAVAAGETALRQAGIASGWIETERAGLSGRADALAARTAEVSVAAGVEELAQGLANLGSRVECAVELARVLGETARPEAREAEGLVQAARGELGAALGLAPERMLREEEADPSRFLEQAGRQADAAQEALGRGDLDGAETALDEAARATAEAAAIVEATRQAFAAQEKAVEERRAETGRVEGLLPEHERILAGIRERFAPSVLALRDGDPGHPEANGTLADNPEEARAHVGFAHGKLDRCVAAFGEGRLLAAARLLREVEAHQELAAHRLEEVAERQARLARTVEANQDLLATLEARVREGRVSIAGDPRTMRPTVASFEQGERQVEQARRAVEAAPGDPFLAEEELLAARATLDQVHDRMAPDDRALHAEAARSVAAASGRLESAAALAQRAAADGIPDSPGITAAGRALQSLAAAQAAAREALGIAHGDWKALDAEADHVEAEAGRWAATLSGEIAAAGQAAEALSRAARKVRDAGAWSGAYGIAVGGRPGAAALSRASSLLEQGRYEEVREAAESAYREAIQAIAAAEAAVRLRRAEEERREEQRRAEERRRRSEAASRSSRSSGSGSGSGGSSWGGGGGSGSSRSSWGSSGSGSGKSRW